MSMKIKSTSQVPIILRYPIVTVLGHVDHGKTTLLDTIRNTRVAAKEHGGITQHISAYQIELPSKTGRGKQPSIKKITFIDTPGHQAFTNMRSRGANVADIAILVIAANDGVAPQTIESIRLIQSTKIPCIVAINKIDLPDVNIEKIKKHLTKLDLTLEEYGGDIPVIPVSAKTGQGIDKLIEMIFLLSDLYQIHHDTPGKLKAVVIESTLSKNRGPVATVVMRSHNLSVGDEVTCEDQKFKVRALINWLGKNQKQVTGGDPVEILGWKEVPAVGSILQDTHQMKIVPAIDHKLSQTPTNPVNDTKEPSQEDKIKFILKSDTAGTLEAILESLKEKSDKITIVSGSVGNINESDIFLAKTTGSIVIGFHHTPPDSVRKLAETEKVIVKTYPIIYELIEEIDDLIEAVRLGNLVTVLGESKILATFTIKNQKIAGVKVMKGRIARGDQVKIIRENQELGRTRIKSLRHGKEDVTVAEQGSEAGVLFTQNIDYLTGDSIISIG